MNQVLGYLDLRKRVENKLAQKVHRFSKLCNPFLFAGVNLRTDAYAGV